MFGQYLRYRRYALFLWFTGTAVLLAVMLLSGIAPQLALYGAFLALFLLGGLTVLDYFRFRERVNRLAQIRENLSNALPELPDPPDAVCAQYDGMIRELNMLMRRERDGLREENAERIDYYTLWLHQIKTPIAAMRLLLDADCSAQRDAFAVELFKVERYVDMALQYAKLGGLAADLVLEPFALDPLVRDCIRKYALLFIQKDLSVDFEATGLRVVSDRKWLGFILEQILSNAAKYTNSGGVRIYLAGTELRIEDTGIGIRDEDAERIFEKGYTGYNGRYDRLASGLGLYMSSRIAQELGVGLRAERGRKSGSCLCLELGGAMKQREDAEFG